MAGKRIVGASRLRRKLKRMPDEIQKEIRSAIAEQAFALRDEISRAAPVSDEGMPKDWEGKSRMHVRDAIEARVSKDGLRAQIGLIGIKVMKVFFFARFLEFGTKKMTKRPFLFPAWRSRREKARAAIKLATQNALIAVANAPTPDA